MSCGTSLFNRYNRPLLDYAIYCYYVQLFKVPSPFLPFGRGQGEGNRHPERSKGSPTFHRDLNEYQIE